MRHNPVFFFFFRVESIIDFFDYSRLYKKIKKNIADGLHS